MPVDHWERACAAAESCADLVSNDNPVRVIAAEYVRNLPRTTRDVLAEDQFCQLISTVIRTRTLQAERSAERAAPTPKQEDKGDGLKHGSTNKRNGAVQTGCQCKRCVETRQSDAEIEARYHQRMAQIVADFRAECHMEWTAELLASTFALPDGTHIAWGDATLEHHQQRVAMFMANATANLEGAARHEEAIAAIRSAGVSRLYDLGGEAAAAA